MPIVNMLEAKSSLSRLVAAVERGEQREIVIARDGKPVAKLVAMSYQGGGRRLGVAAGKFVVPENIDAANESIAALFLGR